VVYDEVHKPGTNTIPHKSTDTGELYAMSTKADSQDTHNKPPLVYSYARVDMQRVSKVLTNELSIYTYTNNNLKTNDHCMYVVLASYLYIVITVLLYMYKMMFVS